EEPVAHAHEIRLAVGAQEDRDVAGLVPHDSLEGDLLDREALDARRPAARSAVRLHGLLQAHEGVAPPLGVVGVAARRRLQALLEDRLHGVRTAGGRRRRRLRRGRLRGRDGGEGQDGKGSEAGPHGGGPHQRFTAAGAPGLPGAPGGVGGVSTYTKVVATQPALMVLDAVCLLCDLTFRLPTLTRRGSRPTRSKNMPRLW